MDVLAGTAAGLYRLRGDTLERIADGSIAALAVDRAVVWAVVEDVTLVRGTANGGFAPVATHDSPLRCLLPEPGGVLVGTADAGLVRLREQGLAPVEDFAAAPGRDEWYTPWGGPPDTRSLAAGSDGTLYANVHVGGILRSSDGGGTWEPTIDVDADVHQLCWAAGLLLAATAYGLAVSADRGATWQWRSDRLHARYARAVAVTGDTVLVSVSQGPGGARAAIYRGALGTAGALTRASAGLPEWFEDNIDTSCLVADGGAVAAADGGTVHHSADGGVTWGVLTADLPAVRCLAPLPS